MRKVTKELTRLVGPVTLHLNDLHEIVEAIEELDGDRSELRITIDDFALDSLEEVAQLEQRTAKKFNFTFIRYEPKYSTFTTYVYEGHAWLRTDDSALSRGVYAKVESLLLKRRRRLGAWVHSIPNYIYILFYVMAVIFVLSYLYTGIAIVGLLGFASLLAPLCLTLADAGLYFGLRSKIFLVDRTRDQSFYTRNKDQLWIGIIIAVVTFLAGVGVTLVVESLTKTK